VTRGGMCELDFSVHAGLGDDKVMLSSYDCSVEEAEVDTPCCLLTPLHFFIHPRVSSFHTRVTQSHFFILNYSSAFIPVSLLNSCLLSHNYSFYNTLLCMHTQDGLFHTPVTGSCYGPKQNFLKLYLLRLLCNDKYKFNSIH